MGVQPWLRVINPTTSEKERDKIEMNDLLQTQREKPPAEGGEGSFSLFICRLNNSHHFSEPQFGRLWDMMLLIIHRINRWTLSQKLIKAHNAFTKHPKIVNNNQQSKRPGKCLFLLSDAECCVWIKMDWEHVSTATASLSLCEFFNKTQAHAAVEPLLCYSTSSGWGRVLCSASPRIGMKLASAH